MSRSKRNINVGAAVRRSDIQAIANVAAAADDAALEVLCTPGAPQKRILPLSEESVTVNPRLLVVGHDTDGTVANAKVRMRPANFIAGVSGDAMTVALSAKQKVALDSPVIGNNSSGSTRTDLLYASISYGTATTESVRKKPSGGGQPVSTPLTTQYDMLVTLAVVAGVTAGSELASLPADDTVNGVYNFGLAALSIANGYAGGAINQASIAPLWTGGGVLAQRLAGFTPSLFAGAAAEKPSTPLTSRWGITRRAIFPVNVRASTGAAGSTGAILDNTIDWRHRLIVGSIVLSGTLAPESVGTPPNIPTSSHGAQRLYLSGAGSTGAPNGPTLTYNTSAMTVTLAVNTDGSLRLCGTGTLVDPTNGDGLVVIVDFTDQLI